MSIASVAIATSVGMSDLAGLITIVVGGGFGAYHASKWALASSNPMDHLSKKYRKELKEAAYQFPVLSLA